MTQATSGFGTLLKIGDGGGPETFTAVAEVTNVGGPSLTRDSHEASHMESPGAWDEHVPGLKRGGEVSLDLNFLPADATQNAGTGLLADLESGVLRNFELVFPDVGATTWSFSALVTAFEPTAPVDDRLTASVTLKVSGQPTLA